MIFFVYYIAAMVLVAAETRGLLRVRLPSTPKLPAIAWIGIIVATYGVQIAVALHLATTGLGPFGVVKWRDGATLEVIAMFATAAIASYALAGLFRTRASTAIVTAGAIAMLAISLVTPVLTNSDLYAYVGNALLGRDAYTPPHAPFAGEFAAINAWWNVPVPPATYGPLWIATAGLVTSAFPSLAAKMFALRAFGAFVLAALILLLRAYGVPARILTLVALNPALYFEFVLNAHNDAFPACIALVAAIVAASRPLLASVLIAVAALVKAPFAVVSLPVLASVKSPALRWVAAGVSIVATLTFSWFSGGLAYLHALQDYGNASHLQNGVHIIAAIAALVAIVAAVAGLRRLRSAVWLVPMLGVYTASWYALWSLPYALGVRRVLIYFCIWLPLATMLAEPAFWRTWTLAIVLPAAVILSFQRPQPGPSYK